MWFLTLLHHSNNSPPHTTTENSLKLLLNIQSIMATFFLIIASLEMTCQMVSWLPTKIVNIWIYEKHCWLLQVLIVWILNLLCVWIKRFVRASKVTCKPLKPKFNIYVLIFTICSMWWLIWTSCKLHQQV